VLVRIAAALADHDNDLALAALIASKATVKAIFLQVGGLHIPSEISAIHLSLFALTADNATVYQIARTYLVPAITHQTKVKERRQILDRFHTGEYSILVTSQVLNEGVDVPEAAVAIVLAGTGMERETVQRLGRVLRPAAGKRAVLYELVARDTGEERIADRRRLRRGQGAGERPAP